MKLSEIRLDPFSKPFQGLIGKTITNIMIYDNKTGILFSDNEDKTHLFEFYSGEWENSNGDLPVENRTRLFEFDPTLIFEPEISIARTDGVSLIGKKIEAVSFCWDIECARVSDFIYRISVWYFKTDAGNFRLYIRSSRLIDTKKDDFIDYSVFSFS